MPVPRREAAQPPSVPTAALDKFNVSTPRFYSENPYLENNSEENSKRETTVIKDALMEVACSLGTPKSIILRKIVTMPKDKLHFRIHNTTTQGFINYDDLPPMPKIISTTDYSELHRRVVASYMSWAAFQHPDCEPICCNGSVFLPTVPVQTSPTTCSILSSWLSKNQCCGSPAAYFCITHKVAFCGKPFCGNSHSRNRKCNVRVNRPQCPQLSMENGNIKWSTESRFWACRGCQEIICDACAARYSGIVILENIPESWTDASVIQALEMCFGCSVSFYDRSPRCGHVYVQFSRQVIKTRTQCLKVREVLTNTDILIKVPHASKKHNSIHGNRLIVGIEITSAELDCSELDIHTDLIDIVVSILLNSGLTPQAVRYAVSSKNTPEYQLAIHVTDECVRSLLEYRLRSFTFRDTIYQIALHPVNNSTTPLSGTYVSDIPIHRREIIFNRQLVAKYEIHKEIEKQFAN